MKQVAAMLAVVVGMTSPAPAVEFVTSPSPDVFTVVPAGAFSRTGKIETKDGHQIDYGFGINKKTWHIDVVIMTLGGFLGVGSKCVAVRPKDVITHSDGHSTVDLTRDELMQAPTYAKDC